MKNGIPPYAAGPQTPGDDPGLFGRVNNYFLLIYACACFMMASSLSGLLYLGGNIVLSVIIPGAVGYILPLLVLTGRYGFSFPREFRLHAPDVPTTALVLLATAGTIYPVDTLAWLAERWRPPSTEYIRILLSFKPEGTLHFAALAAGIVVVTPLGEELLFRGLVQSVFHRNMPVSAALILSGAVFGAAHAALFLMPALTVLGIMLGFVFYRTGNLAYPLMIHAGFNFVSLLRLQSVTEESLRTGAGTGPDWRWLAASALVVAWALAELVRRTRHAAPSG